jgi:two-component system LytT family response regulator
MSKIRTLVVDDEPLARDGLSLLLADDPDIDVVQVCADGRAAVEVLGRERIDLLFIDVQMPELNGFETLARVPEDRLPVIVFVTAFDQYALDAFRVHAVDYLLKPFTDDQFYDVLRHAKAHIGTQRYTAIGRQLLELARGYFGNRDGAVSTPVPQPAYPDRLSVQTGNRIEFVKVAEIDRIEAADYYVEIHVGKKTHLLRKTMNRLEEQLDPSQFIRIHRSTIVRIDAIRQIEREGASEYVVVLHDGSRHPVSKSRHARLRALSQLRP